MKSIRRRISQKTTEFHHSTLIVSGHLNHVWRRVNLLIGKSSSNEQDFGQEEFYLSTIISWAHRSIMQANQIFMKSKIKYTGFKVSVSKILAQRAREINALKEAEDFLKLREIINQYDPVRLLSCGAPENEYDPEVRTILERLHPDLSEAEVLDLVYDEFLRWFGFESVIGKKSGYQLMASDIFNVLVRPT